MPLCRAQVLRIIDAITLNGRMSLQGACEALSRGPEFISQCLLLVVIILVVIILRREAAKCMLSACFNDEIPSTASRLCCFVHGESPFDIFHRRLQ